MSDDESEEHVESAAEVVSPPQRAPAGRVRRWGAEEIARFFEKKSEAAYSKGPEWRANLFIDQQPATVEELRVAPPGSDVMVCVGRAGSSATITQLFELVPTGQGDANATAQLVPMADQMRRAVPGLVSVIERLTSEHIKLIKANTKMVKEVQRSLRKQVKAHKGKAEAEKRAIDVEADQTHGMGAIIKSLGDQLGKEGLERVLSGGLGDLMGLVSKYVPGPTPPPKPNRRARPKARKGKK